MKVFLLAEEEDSNTDSDGVTGLYCQRDVISINNRQKFAQDESLDVGINCGRKQRISLNLPKQAHSGTACLPISIC